MADKEHFTNNLFEEVSVHDKFDILVPAMNTPRVKNIMKTLLCENYDQRWSIEEFFGFENEMVLSRASIMNLNIRYGMLAMLMLARGTICELREKMNAEYKKWDTRHHAYEILA